MALFDITVRITPREGLLDPEGKAIGGALHSLGFEGVESVRAGRLIRMRIDAASTEAARERADAMCRKLLANPVTEDYEVEVEEASRERARAQAAAAAAGKEA